MDAVLPTCNYENFLIWPSVLADLKYFKAHLREEPPELDEMRQAASSALFDSTRLATSLCLILELPEHQRHHGDDLVHVYVQLDAPTPHRRHSSYPRTIRRNKRAADYHCIRLTSYSSPTGPISGQDHYRTITRCFWNY